ncbi:MAG: ATP-binding cassette domain-containing protein [Anaerolineales bacterium]|nr:ATP-binding cassette domain-containing protein [Anaerolineales bacterium]
MISVRDLMFGYPGCPPIFQHFNWSAAAGEAWAILGPSGYGKSTLLYLLAGLRPPTAGTIEIDGQPIHRPRPRTGLILQDFGLLPWANCEQNVSLGLRIHGFYGPDGKHAPLDQRPGDLAVRASHWLARLGLTGVRHRYPGQLSGGQRQRTAIARTLALNPDLLLMDEPFASLDAPTRESLQNLTLELRAEQGLTTVVVTHSIEEAAFLGQRILVFGRAIEVVENPGAGGVDYRDQPDYQGMIQVLRGRLAALTDPLSAPAER